MEQSETLYTQCIAVDWEIFMAAKLWQTDSDGIFSS